MAFADEQVRDLATLARLALTDDEVRRFAAQLDHILAYVGMLRQLDTEQVPPTSHVIPIANVFRPDEVTPSLPVDAALANAPQRDGPFFTVPHVLEDA